MAVLAALIGLIAAMFGLLAVILSLVKDEPADPVVIVVVVDNDRERLVLDADL